MPSRDIDFKWNATKAKLNLKQHHIGFEEAATVFDDPHAVTVGDEDHSEDETREIIIGYSTQNRLLFVSFTVRERIIRLISARTATPRERQEYEEENRYRFS